AFGRTLNASRRMIAIRACTRMRQRNDRRGAHWSEHPDDFTDARRDRLGLHVGPVVHTTHSYIRQNGIATVLPRVAADTAPVTPMPTKASRRCRSELAVFMTESCARTLDLCHGT